jgi:hemin uptake protein HemP
VDGNQGAIVEALRAAGAWVRSTAMVHDGFPDLIVCHKGVLYMMECKTKSGKLTDDEVRVDAELRLHDAWVWIVRDVDTALRIIGAI